MFIVFLLLLTAVSRLVSGEERADTLHDDHHGLHVHLHDQFLPLSLWQNDSSTLNVSSLPEHGHLTKDIFDIADVKEEGIAEDIMQKVRDILAIVDKDDALNDTFVRSKSHVEKYMDLIDSMANSLVLEDTEGFIDSNNDTVDAGGIADYTEYEIEDYFTHYYSDYENGDEYFNDIVINEDSNQTDSKNRKSNLDLLNKVKLISTKNPEVKMNAAFPELLKGLVSLNGAI